MDDKPEGAQDVVEEARIDISIRLLKVELEKVQRDIGYHQRGLDTLAGVKNHLTDVMARLVEATQP